MDYLMGIVTGCVLTVIGVGFVAYLWLMINTDEDHIMKPKKPKQ